MINTAKFKRLCHFKKELAEIQTTSRKARKEAVIDLSKLSVEQIDQLTEQITLQHSEN